MQAVIVRYCSAPFVQCLGKSSDRCVEGEVGEGTGMVVYNQVGAEDRLNTGLLVER